MNSRLAVVAFQIPPVGGGYSERIAGFLRYWGSEDSDISVFCADEAGLGYPIDPHIVDDISDVDEVFRLPTVRGKLTIGLLRSGGVGEYGFKLLNRISFIDAHIYWALIVSVLFCWKHRKRNYNTILTSSTPYSAHVVGIIAKMIFPGVKWVADFRDPWTLNYQKRKSRLLYNFISRRVEQYIYNNADSIVINTEINAKDIINNFSVDEQKIHVIQNGYFEEVYSEKCSRERVNNSRFKIGLFGGTRGDWFLKDVFMMLGMLKKKSPADYSNLDLVLVGHDKFESDLAEKLNVSDCFKPYGFHARSDMPDMLDSMDALLLILPSDGADPLGWVPQRLYMYLASGKPILAIAPTGEAQYYVERSGSGKVFNNNSTADAATLLSKWIGNDYSEIANRDILYIESFSKKALSQKFYKLLVSE